MIFSHKYLVLFNRLSLHEVCYREKHINKCMNFTNREVLFQKKRVLRVRKQEGWNKNWKQRQRA